MARAEETEFRTFLRVVAVPARGAEPMVVSVIDTWREPAPRVPAPPAARPAEAAGAA